MENKEPSKIKLRKNQDGTVTKVLVQKIKKKIIIKKKSSSAGTGGVSSASATSKGGVKTYDARRSSSPNSLNSSSNPPNNSSNKPASSGARPARPTEQKNKKFFVKKKSPHTNYSKDKKSGGDMANFLQEVKSGVHSRDKKADTQRDNIDVISKKENFNKFDKQKHASSEDIELSSVPSEIQIPEVISVKNLAAKLNLKVSQLIKKFLSLGIIDVTVNDTIDSESASIVCSEFNCEVKVISLLEQTIVDVDEGNKEDYVPRSPIVAIMGHVDHGKTTLLDALRSSSIVKGESGGITQHISAYQVETQKGSISFIDTPGHVAFYAMRSRGAKITDIVILVVSAVDGIKPQTIEAIEHIKKEKVPMLVAINKCDLEGADVERVKSELAKYEVVSQEWGGDTIFVNVSALKKQGIDELVDAILLLAELHEIKGNEKVKASGYVLEARVEQGKGNVVDVILKNGILKTGDVYLCGSSSGKIRAMFDTNGESIKQAKPSTPVEIIGISELPVSGELFQVMETEKEARKIVEKRLELMKESVASRVKKVSIDNFMSSIEQSKMDEVKVLIKADVYGTIEVLKDILSKQRTKEIKVSIVQSGAGNITENDVLLAETAQAIIIGFRVKSLGKIQKLADKKKVEILQYDVIYDVIDEIRLRLKKRLKPERIETYMGSALVKEIFKLSSVGKIAGSYVEDGKLTRQSYVKLYRNEEIIFEGEIEMIKHYKDDVKEIKAGNECGIKIKDFKEMKAGDIIKAYDVQEKERELEIIDEV